jgi:hypothetical protein
LLGLLAAKLILVPALILGGPVAQPTFDQFMWAIGQQESGGNYSVVNAYGAVGKYQVLKSNIPGWSKQVLGYSITWQQYRDSPKLQEQIVRGILKGYYDKWGARGAAAAWYAGPGNHDLDMSTKSQPGGPSIKGYVDSVLGRIDGYTAGTSGTTSGASSSGGGAVALSSKELAEQYGYVDALMNSNPELKKLFQQAVSGQWTPDKFQAEVRDTKWWKSHSETERQFLVLKYGDPKTADQKITQAYTRVRQLANQLGLIETSANLKLMNTWAYNMVAKGWDESQLRAEIGKSILFTGGRLEGEAGEHFQALRSYAYSMGVTMSGNWYGEKARAIIRGIGTEQDFKDEIARQAKALYPQFGKQIDAGQTVMDIASPYVQTMQNILEVPAGSISLQDTTLKGALQNKNTQTGESEIMPLWQFENKLRSDPRWNKTQNAQNSMMQVAHQVLADFGVKY